MAVDPEWLEELSSWLRIESVSADAARAGDVRAAGAWVCDFVRSGGGSCRLVETVAGHPLVVGELRASRNADRAPTVLLYGHFDVQPAGDLALWESPPFQPEVRDGWLYGRGTADDKGNFYLLLKAAAMLASEGGLPVNVRIAADGEEEIGGRSIVELLEGDERGADACLVFDTDMPRPGLPAFNIATRGLVYFHVTVRTGARDLHSGLFGGAALNAVHALMQTLAPVVAMPAELRVGAVPLGADERRGLGELESGAELLAREGACPSDSTAAAEFYARTGAMPAVDVNGFHGGEPDLQKTVLPVEAHANLSIRLAPGQDPGEIGAAVERLLRGAAPAGAELKVERWSQSPPSFVQGDAPALELVSGAFERVVGRRPLLLRTGGTIPILPALAARGIPTVLSGFSEPGHNIHGPNERLRVENIALGVEAAREALVALAGLA